MTRKTYHHGDLREALLTEAEAVMARSGIAGLNLRELAKRTGVSPAAPYRHFRTKQDLIYGMAEKGYRMLCRIATDAAKKHPLDPVGQIREVGTGYVRMATEHGELLDMMFGSLDMRKAPESLQTAALESHDRFSSIIHSGQLAGIYHDDMNTEELVISAWSIIHGFAVLCRTPGFQKRFRTQRDRMTFWQRISGQMLTGIMKS